MRIVDIDDSTPANLRKQYVDDFKAGKIDIIVNVNIFSEGFDCPDIEFIQLARPTRSLTMYLQQVGRGLRTTEGKSRCIILDNVGMYSRFGLPDANRHWMAHFLGRDIDESPKRGSARGWSEFDYDEPDLSEGDEDMLLIQESENNKDFEGIEPSQTESSHKGSNMTPEKKESHKPEVSKMENSLKLRRVSASKPDALLQSNSFHDAFCIVADNSFYYVKVLSSGNCYYIAPVLRKPSENDELLIMNNVDCYDIKHIIPDAEKADKQIIGSIRIEGENIVTFIRDFGGKKVETSFEVK